jgi:dihydroorotate dehydrogenase
VGSGWVYPILRAGLFRLDAEVAHRVGMGALRLGERTGLLGWVAGRPAGERPVELMGLRFPNRVGLAAGLDKEGDAVAALGAFGFGFIEIGTITPRPQPGNPRPRVFRLVDREGIINRMGFNNPGIDAAVEHVRAVRGYRGVIGVNIGRNKDTPNERAADDYLACFRKAYAHAGYVAVNLSSPNTPGLRELQEADASARLLAVLKDEQVRLEREHGKKTPLLFKVAPDLDERSIAALSRVFLDGGLDGLIATNTTVSRAEVEGHRHAGEAGGLSGRPLKEMADRVLGAFAGHLGGRIPLVGVGGISSVEDARDKIRLGASLVQIYSSFIYRGPGLVRDLACSL